MSIVTAHRVRSPSLFSKKAVALHLLVVAVLLSGCSENEKNRSVIEKQARETRTSLEQVTNQGAAERFNPLTVTDKVWAGDIALRIHRGIPLPPKYEADHAITLVSAEPMSVSDIANAILAQTGIPVHLADLGAPAPVTGTPSATAGAFGTPATLGRVIGPTVGTAGGNANYTMSIAYEGPLSGLLDRIAGNMGVSWHYDGRSISISRFETRVFVIEALPGTQKNTVDMQGGTSSGSSSGGGSSGGGTATAGGTATSSSTIESKSDVDLKYWEELKDILTSMLGGTGTVVMSPALGTITITTTPEIMQGISSYLAQENERMSREIAVSLEVYNLQLTKDEDFNITFATFLHHLGTFGPVALAGASAPSSVGSLTGLASASVAILNEGAGHSSITDVFNALSSVGNTTRVAQFPLVTLNNRPVSVRIGHDIDYVASTNSSTTASSSVGATTQVTVTPGQINEGFSVLVSPRLLDDGRILLQYALTSVDLDSIAVFNSQCGIISTASSSTCESGTSSSTLQLPTTTNRSFTQQAVLRSGSTLIIGGINQKDLTQNAQGVGDAFNFLFGGGSSNETQDTMMLIAISPQVIDLPRGEHG